MADVIAHGTAGHLGRVERSIAGFAGTILLLASVILVVTPPSHQVALQQCTNASAGCIVSVSSDLTTLAIVLAGAGFVAIVIAVLGIRFNSVKAAGTELSQTDQFRQESAGLGEAPPSATGIGTEPMSPAISSGHEVEVEVEVFTTDNVAVKVAVVRLSKSMRDVDSSVLRAYQLARRSTQNMYSLTHILGPATRTGQKYSVAILVTPHRKAEQVVKSASFYLGPSWGNKIFTGRQRPDGRFGIVTEAYQPFTALCEVEFESGTRIVLDHYCDFDMGALLAG